MANALVLTASSLGRTSQPSGAGAVISVDGDNPVTIDAWPQPSRWVPQEVRLLRDEHEVRSAPAGDELRWVLMGDERFGVFRVIARAGGTLVESHPMVVQPASSTYVLTGSSPAQTPGRFVRPSRAAGTATAARPSTATPTPTLAPPGTPTPGLAPAATPTPSVAPAASASGVAPLGTDTPVAAGPADAPPAVSTAAGTASPAAGPTAPGPSTAPPAGPTAPAPTTTPDTTPTEAPPDDSPAIETAPAPASSPSGGSAPASANTAAPTAGPATAPTAAPADSGPPAGPPGTAAKLSAAGAAPTPADAGPRPAGAKTKAARAPGVPAHASAEDIAAMVEVPHGEYDGRFTAWVAAAFALLTLAVLGFAGTRLLGDPNLFASASPDAAAVESGGSAPFVRPSNTADRIGLGASTMVLALGAVVLLAGAALAALEVRGRQRRHAGTSTVARGSAAALRQVAVIVDRMSQPRAVIAVLVAGGVLLLVGFFGQLHWGARL